MLIAVMVVIFGIALLAPFPGRRHAPADAGQPPDAADQANAADRPGAESPAHEPVHAAAHDDPDARMWTARVRRRALALLPPDKLLSDRQPAYVASWMYVFGVATLAALGIT